MSLVIYLLLEKRQTAKLIKRQVQLHYITIYLAPTSQLSFNVMLEHYLYDRFIKITDCSIRASQFLQ